MKKSLKAAVIGAGKMGSYHANILKGLDVVELCALVTKTRESARIQEKEYKVPVYTSLVELFSKQKLDFVTVSSPTIYHKIHAIKALEQGCHVLLEKPIAIDTKEAHDIIEVERRSGRKVMVGHIERFNPVVLMTKRLLEKKALGEIFLYNGVRAGNLPENPTSDVLLDLGIHDFDLFNFLICEKILKISCEKYKKLNRQYDDVACISGKSVGGIVFNYQTDWLRKVSERETVIVGKEGELKLDFIEKELTMFNDESPDGHSIEIDKDVNQLEEEIKSFVKCILRDEKVPISTKDGLEALEMYEACMS